jgi:hypothetical protein
MRHPTDRRTGRCQNKKSRPEGMLRAPTRNYTARLIAIATTAAAATTATTAVITTTTTATAATAARTFFTGLGNVDCECATAKVFAVQRVDGFLRLFRRAHGDETKTARTASGAIHHQVGFQNGAVCGERVLQVVFSGVEGKISYEQFATHCDAFFSDCLLLSRRFPTIGSKIITERGSLEDCPCLK